MLFLVLFAPACGRDQLCHSGKARHADPAGCPLQSRHHERRPQFRASRPDRIDCYRDGCFVLEAKKVGAGGTVLSVKEKAIHEKGPVAVLKSLHEELDAAVQDAYGWHDRPSDETQLAALEALGRAHRLDEKHWLG